jgi:integrase
MARQLNRLSARAVTSAKPGKYADGGGLWLQVTPTGAKSWVFRYSRGGSEQFMGLGPVHTVSLADARQSALAARQALLAGRDPLAERRAAQAKQSSTPTFAEAYAAYIAEHRAGWKNPKHVDQWTNTLDTYAKPKIGEKRVDEIVTADVMAVLQPIWQVKTETATRVRGRIEAVLDAEKVRGNRAGENPARWRGHLDKLLPPPKKIRKVQHFAAMPFTAVPGFMARLRARPDVSARALEFLILTAMRTQPVRLATWSEVRADVWHIPAGHMKGHRPHAVPLPAALALLEALPREGTSIFPGRRGSKAHMSSGAMDKLLQQTMGEPYTVHGFRSSFKDWASETTHFPNEVSEAALAHKIENDTEAAYRRGELLAKRRELMDAWAAYLAQSAGT